MSKVSSYANEVNMRKCICDVLNLNVRCTIPSTLFSILKKVSRITVAYLNTWILRDQHLIQLLLTSNLTSLSKRL